MPARGTIMKYHGRQPFLGKALWKKYVKTTGNKIPYKEFMAIIEEEIKEVRKWTMREPIGFQIPNLGNIAVNRFRPRETFVSYIYNGGKTKIKNHNLHTGGYSFKIQWFRLSNTHTSRLGYYYFVATREFNRDLGQLLKSGEYPNFNCYAQDHFLKKTK